MKSIALTRSFRYLAVLSVSLAGLPSCSFVNSTNSAYNTAARVGWFTSEDDSFIIGVEKIRREEAGFDPGIRNHFYEAASASTHSRMARDAPDQIDRYNRNVEKFLGGPNDRVMVVTHILQARKDQSVSLAYQLNPLKAATGPGGGRSSSAYRDGYGALDRWSKNRLAGAFEKAAREGKPFSHVFVMCMGWVNDQQESSMRFRSITHHLREAAAKEGDRNFRPLVIGVTWPSGWLTNSDSQAARRVGHLASYGTKSNDADEVGLMVISPIIHRYLKNGVPAKTPIIAIGHSFGARAMSRAVYSAPLMREAPTRVPQELISLQPAYSLRRWLSGESGEGTPYMTDSAPRHYITASKWDSANPQARWSIHGGGGEAIDKAKEHPDVFNLTHWDRVNGRLQGGELKEGLPTVIDAGEIVIGTDGPKETEKGKHWDAFGLAQRSGHNDVLDEEMGELLYYVIKNKP